MTSNNISSVASMTASPARQGAVIRSVATMQEYKVHYGVQSATFTRTVFPGQASGTYRLNGMIPHHRGAKIVASGNTGATRPSSPPVPYPPRNASAYYSSTPKRIVPNPCFIANG